MVYTGKEIHLIYIFWKVHGDFYVDFYVMTFYVETGRRSRRGRYRSREIHLETIWKSTQNIMVV